MVKPFPRIGITMGDPAGIGPEIAVKALADPEMNEAARLVILGDPAALSVHSEQAGVALRVIHRMDEARPLPGVLDVLSVSRLEPDQVLPGKPTLEGGRAMAAAITRAVELALQGDLDAVVTGPISKVLLQQAGHMFEGHTQFLAHLTGSKEVVMMLAGEKLRVTLVTIHCALRDVPRLLTEDAILRTLILTDQGLRTDFGFAAPRLAVAALNPHAGEKGLFGDEETRIIEPAVRRARAEGLRVAGPLPADTVFVKAASGGFDAVICMYHDQGLIPLKLLHFTDGVNVTLGLPIIRTSVDHGTAYDIAGKGIADPSSLRAAIRTAALMAENRKNLRRNSPT